MSEFAPLVGFYLDGDVAVPDVASIDLDDANRVLVILSEGGKMARWPYAELRALRDQAGTDQMVLRLAGDATPRLIISGVEDIAAIHMRAPKLGKAPPVKGRGRLVLWAAGALASVALIILVLIPIMADQLAEYLPPEGEKALGEATLGQIRAALDETGLGALPFCENPEGLAALAKLQDALEANAGLETELSVHVLKHPMVNAFALPGGDNCVL